MEKFTKLLKARGMKATKQRLAIHKAMLELGHASADMVCDLIKSRDDVSVTSASVYNTLSQLTMAGIYKHRMSPDNKMYFDVNKNKHIHFYDSFNNTFRDLDDKEIIEAVEEKLKGRHFRGFKICAVDIQIIGYPSRRKAPLSF